MAARPNIAPALLAFAATTALACGPEIPSAFAIDRPKELAIRSEVVASGPWGTLPAEGRVAEALPGDTVRLEPFVVGPDGPIDLDDLDVRWFVCDDANCVSDAAAVPPACAFTLPGPLDTCTLAEGPTPTFVMPEFSTDIEVFDDLLFASPAVLMVASLRDDPGVDACLERYEDRVPLDGCMLSLTSPGIGPVSTLLDIAQVLGVPIEPEVQDYFDSLIQRPRDLHPTLQQFRVTVDGESRIVERGDAIEVSPGSIVSVFVAEEDAGLQTWEVEAMDGLEEPIQSEILVTTWFGDRVDAEFEGRLNPAWFTANGPAGRTYVYAVVRDNYRGTDWGWLEVEILER